MCHWCSLTMCARCTAATFYFHFKVRGQFNYPLVGRMSSATKKRPSMNSHNRIHLCAHALHYEANVVDIRRNLFNITISFSIKRPLSVRKVCDKIPRNRSPSSIGTMCAHQKLNWNQHVFIINSKCTRFDSLCLVDRRPFRDDEKKRKFDLLRRNNFGVRAAMTNNSDAIFFLPNRIIVSKSRERVWSECKIGKAHAH